MAKIPKGQPPPGFSYARWEGARQQAAAFQAGWEFVRERTPAQRLEWVLRFIREDPGKLPPAERAKRGYILRAIFKGGTYDTTTLPMPDTTLRALQRKIAEGVRGLASTQGFSWRIPGPAGHLVYRQNPVSRRGRGGAEIPARLQLQAQWEWGKNEVGAILYGVADLLRVAGEKLRACVVCGQPFLGRKRAIYCPDSECGQQRRDERKRERAQEHAHGRKGKRATTR